MKPQQFLDQSIRHWACVAPASIALRCGKDAINYAELDAKVSERAEKLRSWGLGPNDRIGLYCEKSLECVVAAYAILRCGAAYVPLDPGAPIARLLTITENCGIKTVVSEASKSSAFSSLQQSGVDLIVDTRADPFIEREPKNPSGALGKERQSNDLAYILYTSGSTGTPKGIAHTHKSGLAYADMAANLCDLQPTDRVSNHTPLHFDMSIFDIFSTSLAGACAVIIPSMVAKLPASLSKYIEQQRITVWYSVPFAMISLAERGALDARDLSSLRLVMFAGEKMQPSQLKRFADFVHAATYINAYGPTETNHCTSHVIDASQIDGVTPIPIGHASEGVDALVLSDGLPSDQGQLYIASDQVMQGYWADPERSDNVLYDLAGTDGVQRKYYATGDMVTRLQDGTLDLIGRSDRQVKVRGFRVELDEVELALSNCFEVSEAAVLFRPTSNDIIAFVSLLPDKNTNPKSLQMTCSDLLPPYAVPSEVHILPALARTSTGKVDRKKLAEVTHD